MMTLANATNGELARRLDRHFSGKRGNLGKLTSALLLQNKDGISYCLYLALITGALQRGGDGDLDSSPISPFPFPFPFPA